MFLSLTIICVVAGAILAGVNMYTTGPIAATKAATLEKAIKEVTPEFNNKPTEEAYMAATSDGDSLKIYPAKQDGKFVGAAVESNTMKGFGGEIRVIVGFDIEGKLLNYSVLQDARMVPHRQESPERIGTQIIRWRTESNQRWWRRRCHNSIDHYQPGIPERCEPRLQRIHRCRRIDRCNHIIR